MPMAALRFATYGDENGRKQSDPGRAYGGDIGRFRSGAKS
jgi:hypothetical protein